jgi:hypothetical protein
MIESLHNLLSHERLQKLRFSYYTRIGIVTFIGLSVVVCMGIVALLPSYFELSGERAILSDDVNFLQTVQQKNGNHSDVLRSLRERVQTVESYLTHPQGSTYLDLIFDRTPSGVVLRTFKYDHAAGALVLQGSAETRSDFVAFTNDLESVDAFKNVTFPVGDLAPSIDLLFTVTIEIATTTPNS